ncbi:E3 ubiquitin-protein ligase MYLIP-like isoform X2 [Daphnia carinata]|uniref:E3 ubiquitin-protein ligase MYLIP-like isoform X2 n=1 Tax=Daphnia carinata TaxID=120202 RepID=UPI00257D163E|nr:E3 ubiquitin-protein ligase MYLIP-like isoform X2 [Daphnia carinata]
MWCLVAQPNATKNADLVIEVRLSHKATGQECLNQVCQKLGIIESDYFGLQFTTARKEEIWLNLRNEIRQEIHAHPFRPTSTDGGKPAAIRFRLRVKFWVPPHLILQESTRHQFYLQAKVDLIEGRLSVADPAPTVRICALVAQSEMGDATGMPCQTESYLLSFFPHVTVRDLESFQASRDEWIARILQQHQTLKGMSATLAEYWMLKEVSQLKDYGTETFRARWILAEHGASMRESVQSTVAVSPQGVCITSIESDHRLSVPFCAIQAATNHNVRFLLKHRNDLGGVECASLKLETYQASIALYRSITEKHAFYSCETVRSAVTSQFVRDLKGTIASFFNENTDLGKKYIFDIQRTCREVYDNARRILYQAGDTQVPAPSSPSLSFPTGVASCSDSSCKSTREQLNRLQEALLCRICMDDDISAVFCPCGHAVACSLCAKRCVQCPVCRAPATHTQPIFLPLSVVKEGFTMNNGNNGAEQIEV